MAELIAELVAFVIMLIVLWRFVLPVITRLVQNRQDAVQRQVEDAETATRELNEAHTRLGDSVERARQEGARIRDDARADATSIREELTAQAEEEVARMKQRGEEQLAAERDQVVRALRADLGGTSIQLAERMVNESLADDAARRASVDAALAEIENLPVRGAVTTGGGS